MSLALPEPADPAGVDPALFRRAIGRFPTGVCVVTTRVDGLDHAMTASAVTSVSLEPLLLLVCVECEARFHDAVLEAGVWGASVLSDRGRRVAEWLATRGRPLHGQLDQVRHHRGPVTGVALVEPALSWLECRTSDVHPAGDHSIVVGEVLSVGLAGQEHEPLVYHRGAYRHLR